ncbi:hypothetical protein ACIBHX_41070 [Nonomuraea sp. NPDC050536]|uniref:hypothetical protein n=1 Tax=Nonomuraea sp. NPDC050536 TaxID=3364366 RepID=UPI0037C61EA0
MTSHNDDLEAELLALGASLDVPAPDPADTAAAVRARLEPAEPEPEAQRPRRRPRRWLVVTAIVLVVAAITAATPQGRAAVARILRLAGIEVTLTTTTPSPVPTPTTPPGEHTVPNAGSFPKALGPPQETRRSEGVVSMLWPGGIRLDRIDGGLSPYFFKEVGPPWPDPVTVRGVQGWWISGGHRLSYLRRADDTKIPLRLAGPTLIWSEGDTGYRLEGVTDRTRAVQIADSLG